MIFSKPQRFLISHSSNSIAMGIHLVLLSWIAVGLLGVSGIQLGWLHGVALLPNLVFLLISGVCCDRFKPEKVMAIALIFNFISYLFLAFVLYFENLTFTYLVIYGISISIGNAFIQTSREKILSTINTYNVQTRLSLASIFQFLFQSLGIALASTSDYVGYPIVVLLQGVCVFIAAVLIFPLRTLFLFEANEVNNKRRFKEMYSELLSGFQYVNEKKALQHLLILIGFNGYMHLGVYIVALPILSKTIYGFSAAEYGALQFTFVVGMMAAHVQLIYKKTVTFPGQGALFSLLYTAMIGFALTKGPTIYGLYFIVFCWGYVAGNSAGRCRLVAQAISRVEEKGRVMSIYQFILFGLAALGALVTGHVVSFLNIKQIFYVMSLSSIAMFVFFIFTRELWKVKQLEEG